MNGLVARSLVVAAFTLTACSDVARAPNAEKGKDAAAPSTRDGDWAFYGHDYENSRANLEERTLSRSNVRSLRRLWSYDEAPVTSTPTRVGDTVYFGTWHASLEAVDATSGAPRWSAQLQEPNGINQVNHTPFVGGDTIYAGGLEAELFAIDRATGHRIWKDPIRLDAPPELLLWSSPVVVDDLLVIGVGSFQVFIPASPVFRGSIVAIDVRTGQTAWQRFVTSTSGVAVWSSAAIDLERHRLFIGTGQPYVRSPASPLSDALVAIDLRTGELAWWRQFTANDAFQLGGEIGDDYDVGATPNLFTAGGQDLVGVGDKEGTYHAHDRETGDEVWRRKLTPGGANGGVMASAAYHAGTIYVASNDGTSGGVAGAGNGPAAGRVFALDAATGKSRWELAMTPGTFGALAYANGLVFLPTLDGKLHVLDAERGDELWSDQVGESIASGVSVSHGVVYVGHGWSWIPSLTLRGGVVAYSLP